VVADQQCGVAVSLEGGHAVVCDRHRRAVAHGLPDLRERHVLEPFGERQDLVAVLVGDSGQLAVAAVALAALRATMTPSRRRGAGGVVERLEQGRAGGSGAGGGRPVRDE
jgi:hypothetical protein